MSENLSKRIGTSIVLLFLLLLINFSHHYIFIISILILGLIICLEAKNLFSKLLKIKENKQKKIINTFNLKFLILNIITFYYIFFIFCNFSYEIYRSQSPIFFLYIISICFFTDIGGYVFGKIIGGKKLSKISPNKTISGTVGSFILSIVPLLFFINFDAIDLEFNQKNVIFCLLVSLISQLGDLFISLIKRKAKIKDTSNLLPGHGGILDRVDGIIFAMPFSYFLIKLF